MRSTDSVHHSGVLIIIGTYGDKVLYNVIKQASVLIDRVFISSPANGVAIQLTVQIFEDSVPPVTLSPISLRRPTFSTRLNDFLFHSSIPHDRRSAPLRAATTITAKATGGRWRSAQCATR